MADFRNRVMRFYDVDAPDKLSTVDQMLEKHAGAEDQLIAALVQKFGPEPSSIDVLDRVHANYEQMYAPNRLSTVNNRPHLLALTALPTALIGEVFGFLPTPRDQALFRAMSWTTLRAFDEAVQNERFVALAGSRHVITDWHATILGTFECPVYLPFHERALRRSYPSAIFPTAVANVKLTCAMFGGHVNVYRDVGQKLRHSTPRRCAWRVEPWR
jgi:hypothetical protein